MAITAAGSGSGLDLESIISASVAAKKAQLLQPIITKQNTTQITLSGMGQLSSAISSYTSSLDSLSATGAFNTRAVNITQSTDDPVMKIEAKDDAANGQYNITVNKLATTSKFQGQFDSSTSSLTSEAGQLTFKAGSSSFTVNVSAGDTLQQLRQKINNNASNFGLTANIITTSDGKSQLVIDSGVSGDGKDLSISASNSALSQFDTSSSNSVMKETQKAGSASINVDGNTVTSDTNVFDDSIKGLKLTVLRVSDKDTTSTTGGLLSNQVNVTTDKSAIQTLIQKFVDGYNSLVSSANVLGKRDSVVAGVNQNDGGSLAGDPMPNAITSMMSKLITTPSTQSKIYSSIFDVGVSMDNTGKLSLDTTKLSDALDANFDQVSSLFGGTNGLAAQMNTALKQYTQTGGLISIRQDALNTQLRSLASQQSTANDQITRYETNLRKQYGSLDSMLASMKKSASYLSTITSSSSSSS